LFKIQPFKAVSIFCVMLPWRKQFSLYPVKNLYGIW